MANIIKTDTLQTILTAVDRHLRSIEAHTDIYQMCSGKDKTVQCGVNWAACGTVLPEEAKRFVDVLEHATHICEVLNSYKWTEEWGSDYETEADYRKDLATIFEGLEAGKDIKELIDQIV